MAAHRILGAGNLLILPPSMTTTICFTFQLSVLFVYPCLQNICLHLVLIQPISPPNCNSSTSWRKGWSMFLVSSAFLPPSRRSLKIHNLTASWGKLNLTPALAKSLLTLVWHKNNPTEDLGRMKGFDYWIVSHAYSILSLLFISHIAPNSQLLWKQDPWDAPPVSAILVYTFLPFPFAVWVREETRAIHQSAPPEPRVITHQIAHFLGHDASATGYIKIPACKMLSWMPDQMTGIGKPARHVNSMCSWAPLKALFLKTETVSLHILHWTWFIAAYQTEQRGPSQVKHAEAVSSAQQRRHVN